MKKILFILVVALFASCSVEQHIHFNVDGSGRLKMKMNLNSMQVLLAAEDEFADTTNNTEGNAFNEYMDSLLFHFDEIKKQLETVPGISNAKIIYEKDSNLIFMSYDFVSASALSKSYIDQSAMLDEGNSNRVNYFSKEKKKFVYKAPKPEPEGTSTIDITSDEEEMSSTPPLSEGMMEFVMRFSFDQKIKSVSNKDYIISEDGKSVIFKGDFIDLIDHPEKLSIEVKLK